MKFLLDHDVPDEVELLLRHWKHDPQRLCDVLPITTSDEKVFAFAQAQKQIIISCNRNHFLQLARAATLSKEQTFAGLIILIRRRTRQAECAHLLSLLRRADETGLIGNINLA